MAARELALAGARVAAGLVALIIAGATVAGATLLPLPTITAAPDAQVITPAATGEVRVCPGALRLIGGDAATGSGNAESRATELRVVGSAAIIAHGDLDQQPIAGEPDAGALRFSAQPGVDPATVSASQSQSPNRPELRGFAATACTDPANDAWLVGGSTTVGRSGVLVLSNPYEVAATVNLTFHGARGRIAAPGATGITVPPRSQQALPLAAFAPDEPTLVVRVESRGGTVAAVVQHSVERGLDAGGVDLTGAVAAPSTRQVLPGVVISEAAATLQQLGRRGYDDVVPVVRVFVPGATGGTVRIGVVPSAGGAGSSISAELDPGIVTDLPIGDLADGDYSITVESTVPVVAAARVSTVAPGSPPGGAGAPGAADLMWAGSVPALSGPAQFSVPAGVGARLHLANPGRTAITVTIAGADAAVSGGSAIEVAPGAMVAVPVTASVAYRIEGAGVHAAVVFSAPGALATVPVTSPRPLEEPVRVFVR